MLKSIFVFGLSSVWHLSFGWIYSTFLQLIFSFLFIFHISFFCFFFLFNVVTCTY